MLLARGSVDVVVVAGLPGAGKTTLVASEPRALDSDALRLAWAPRLRRVPYALWRPLVHARHWIEIWRALKRPDGVIVVRPFTAAWLRCAVLRRARRHHPAVHLVVVDATPAEAQAGQRARGRTIGERAMRRHERRWARADFAREPWTTVTRVPARSADPQTALGGFAPREPSMGAHRPGRRKAPMLSSIRRTAAAVAALGALALGGAAMAGAAEKSGSSSQARPQREALPSEVAAKVEAAALEEVPGATVVRTEGDGPYSTPHHAHVTTSTGAQRVVLVNASLEATAVQAARARGGPARDGRHGPPPLDQPRAGR